MLFGIAILATALLLSAVAEFYSIAGLVAIFSAAPIPVIIMGASLGLGKVIATVWLHNNWKRVGLAFKAYLIPAIAFLMILTSMGIFGYLSKAHSDQSLVSGDVQAKISVYDEKIKTSKDNIDANRKALKQMDEAVDQIMGRSADEKGADKAVSIRRSQAKERARLLSEIAAEQNTIATVNEARAPIAAEVRKVEAEVGPIKYIAALMYGDNPDANLLEKAVRLVIIMIVLVFDPLALTLILAANRQFEWAREGKGGWVHDQKSPAYESDDGAIGPEVLNQLRARAKEELPQGELVIKQELFPTAPDLVQEAAPLPETYDDDDEVEQESSDEIKAAMTRWKEQHPSDTLKNQRNLLQRGEIDQLPWLLPASTESGFGPEFPQNPHKGDIFVRIDRAPNQVYKFNGTTWIQVDKAVADSYTYNTAYIDHLIEKISQGEYDPDLLSDSEQEQVEQRLKNTTNK